MTFLVPLSHRYLFTSSLKEKKYPKCGNNQAKGKEDTTQQMWKCDDLKEGKILLDMPIDTNFTFEILPPACICQIGKWQKI